MSAKHTPGPWHRIEDQNHNRGSNLFGQPFYRQIIAGLDGKTVLAGDMGEADATLIANAPAMLGALKEALETLSEYVRDLGPCDHSVGLCCCGEESVIENVRDVIAKAEGRWPEKAPCMVCGAADGHDDGCMDGGGMCSRCERELDYVDPRLEDR